MYTRSGGRSASATLAAVQAAIDAGQLREAHQTASEALKRFPGEPRLHLALALIADRAEDHEAVLHHAERVLSAGPHPVALMLLSRVERSRGRTAEAVELCDRALELAPGTVELLTHKAGALEEAGRFAEARAVVDPLIASIEERGEPLPVPLRFELAKLLVQEKNLDRAVEVIDGVVSDDSAPQAFVRLSYYLRAKAQDRAGDYPAAFRSATLGNEMGRLEFDPELYEQQVTTLMEIWSAEGMAEFPRSSCESELPVFVAGMPRSGTSLIDQIIDAHPKAAGVGELASIERFAAELSAAYNPDRSPARRFGSLNRFRWTRVAEQYVREIGELAPHAERVVNKALGNNKLVGLLALLFPNTRVIHALRDPRDVAISCYMGGFNNRKLAWTTSIEWAARAWEQSQRMMDHWKRTLDVPILEVRYEELVSNPDEQFPRLIEFLGLEWDEACRQFHSSGRTVRTLSYDQVNRPLYTTSAGRHTRYADQIAGVRFPAYSSHQAD